MSNGVKGLALTELFLTDTICVNRKRIWDVDKIRLSGKHHRYR